MEQSPITVVGNLVVDPEIQIGRTGTSWAKLRVAATRRKPDAEGVWHDASRLWIDVKVFRGLAENVCESLRKGDQVVVVGHLETEEWQTAEGQQRSTMVLKADTIAAGHGRATARITKVRRTSAAQEPDEAPEAVEVPADASSLTASMEVAPF